MTTLLASRILQVLAPLLALLGGWLLARGWRGRTIGWTPHCRRCGFDLRTSAANLPPACPECGAPLQAPGAVRSGARAHRRGLLAAGTALVLCASAVTAVSATGLVHAIPQWWLARRTVKSMVPDLAKGDGATWNEVRRRLRDGELDDAGVAAAAGVAVDRIIAAGAPGGVDEWFLSELSAANRLPESEDRRLCEGILKRPGLVKLTVAPESVAPGAGVAVAAALNGLPGRFFGAFRVRVDEARPATGGDAWKTFPGMDDEEREDRPFGDTLQLRAPTAPGVYALNVKISLRAFGAAAGAGPGQRADLSPPDTPPLATATQTLPVTVEVVNPESVVITTAPSPRDAALLQSRLATVTVRSFGARTALLEWGSLSRARLTLDLPAALRVTLVQGAARVEMGSLLIETGSLRSDVKPAKLPPEVDLAKPFELEFAPDEAYAKRSLARSCRIMGDTITLPGRVVTK